MGNDDEEGKRGSTVCSQRTVGGPPEGRGGAARRAVRSLRTCGVSEERKIKDRSMQGSHAVPASKNKTHLR